MTHRLRLTTQLTIALSVVCFFAAGAPALADGPEPVLMVISNQDFYYQEYTTSRASLEAAGLEVVVAAATTETARPHGSDPDASVQPDLALSDVDADDFSAIVFIGGWGSSSYQYAFEGTYQKPEYRTDAYAAELVNRLIGRFLAENKPVGAICHGVTVLAWAQVDGVSPLFGRTVVASAGGVPAHYIWGDYFASASVPSRSQIEANGAKMLTSGSVGDPLTSTDDVVVDGRIITAENWTSASRFAEVFAQAVARGR